MSRPSPPSNGTPSILPSKSTVTRSLVSALAPSGLAVKVRRLSAIRSSDVVDVGFVDVGRQPLELDLREIADLERRQHFERDLEREIAARLERGLDRGLVGRQFDLRLAGEAQAVVVDDLLVGVVDRLLDDVGHHRLAVDPAQMLDRHLARAKSLDLRLRLELGELAVQLLGEIARGQEDVVFALQPLAQRLRHLHRPIRLVILSAKVSLSRFPTVAKGSCPAARDERRLDSALQGSTLKDGGAVVRAEGLEPPQLSSPEPKSGASTNSATPAAGAGRRASRAGP